MMVSALLNYVLNFENAFVTAIPGFAAVAFVAYALKPITGAVPGPMDDPLHRQPTLGMMDGKEPFDMTRKEFQLWQKIRFLFGVIFGIAAIISGCVGTLTDVLDGGDPGLRLFMRFQCVLGSVAFADHSRMYYERNKLGIRYGKWPLLVACFVMQSLISWYQMTFLVKLEEEMAVINNSEKDVRVMTIKACVVTCLTMNALTNVLRVVIIPLMGSDYWFEPKDKKKEKAV